MADFDPHLVQHHYPRGRRFRTFAGDVVEVVAHEQNRRSGLLMLVVQYPDKQERIYPFNGHTTEDGKPIEPTPPQDVCENDTMAL